MQEGALNFKGLSQDGTGRIFLKISMPLSVIHTYQMTFQPDPSRWTEHLK
jgi:hypothetical protein